MPELASWPSIGTPFFSDPVAGSATDHTYAVPVGAPIWDVPISATTKAYVFRQTMQQYAASYAALALNTAYPNAAGVFTGYILVGEGPRQDIGGGIVRWQRIWAKVPDTHNEWEMFVYSFIGYYLTTGGTPPTIITANPRPIPSKSRVQHDYFMVGGSASITDPITGTVYGSGLATPGAIDKIWAMQYVAQATIGGATYGGIIIPVTQLQPSTSSLKTWPVSDDYQNNMVSDALQNSWSALASLVVLNTTNTLAGGPPYTSGHMAGTINTSSSTQHGQIPAEDSRLDRWMGNIFLRRTRYVLAQ